MTRPDTSITGRAVTVVSADPVTDARWHELATRPAAGLFTSPPWIAAVCGAYGFTAESRIAVDAAGRPLGGLAWVPVDDVRGRRLLSMPFSDRADPPVPDTATWERVYDAADTGDTPFTLRCLDSSPVLGAAGLRREGEAAWHGTPLDADLDELHRRIASQSRRNIAAAQRGGVHVEVRDDLAAVRIMHGLHVRLRKAKYGLLAQPLEFFERIWQEFAPDGRCLTLLARLGDEIVAAALFLEWNGQLYYKYGASVQEHLRLRPNDAIYWAGIRLGVERGLALVDWGLSDLDQPGLVGFKRKWATQERRLLTVRSGTPRPTAAQREFGDALGGLTALLTDGAVPDDVTARAGALLYRYFC
jgi:CelD/BcsL family acetyltransferase involved in cellulose biosynthesis